MSESASTTRGYHSPLRRAQADRTRDLILDALTELLAARPSDEISTKDIAAAAGVAERTVYRHFPDRGALHEGLAERWRDEGPDIDDVDDLDEIVELVAEVFAGFDADPIVARAGAMLNADPRRLAQQTRHRTQRWVELAKRSCPDLSDEECRRLAAITRMMGSSQSWLRLRQEFELDEGEVGALTSWAIRVLIGAARSGDPPPV